MWYTLSYANTFICTPAHGGRAGNIGDRSPVRVRLYRPPLPDPPRPCRGAVDPHHGTSPARHRADGAPCHACLAPARLRRAAAPLVTTALSLTIFDAEACAALRALLHQSPRTFGQPPSRWTLALAAEVSFAPGLPPRLVSDEAIRVALRRLRVAWKRAKQWTPRPDPASTRKQNAATG